MHRMITTQDTHAHVPYDHDDVVTADAGSTTSTAARRRRATPEGEFWRRETRTLGGGVSLVNAMAFYRYNCAACVPPRVPGIHKHDSFAMKCLLATASCSRHRLARAHWQTKVHSRARDRC